MSADGTFIPAPGLWSGHAITIYAWARARQFPGLPVPESRLLQVAPDTQVRADCYWQPDRLGRLTILGLHGLEGSSEAHYMRGIAHKAWRCGCNIVLLNQRNCGGTEHLTPGLYHSGLTSDPQEAIRVLAATEGLTRLAVAGYSLGGNLALKLAGELPDQPDGARLPITAVAAVCPTIDLPLCVTALEWRQNWIYQWHFVKGFKARMRRKAISFPDHFDLSSLNAIHTVRQFDDAFTAPHHGFGTAARYYELAGAIRTVSRIDVPSLIVAAKNDPFVPASQFEDTRVRGNPHIRVNLQQHGGHCGFVGRLAAGSDGYWAEEAVVDFLIKSSSHMKA